MLTKGEEVEMAYVFVAKGTAPDVIEDRVLDSEYKKKTLFYFMYSEKLLVKTLWNGEEMAGLG